MRPIRVVFCWAEVSGYMAACWRALAAIPGVSLHIVHLESFTGAATPLDTAPLMLGLSHQQFRRSDAGIDDFLRRAVVAFDPDVVVLCGWIYWPYTRLLRVPELRHARFILGMDSPWIGSFWQRFARWRLAHVVSRLDLVVTAGVRSAEYARRIGVEASRIRSGYYGFDYDSFARERSTAASPRGFLFVGRYVPAKGLDILMAAYAKYRSRVSDPWPLTCRGAGPNAALLHGQAGVTDAGFMQPGQLPEAFHDHRVFVLPSRYEPWGVVIAEAAAAGLPVICTSVCGAATDVVRPYYNGVVVPPDDAEALAGALQWVHEHAEDLDEFGRRGRQLAHAFSADSWASRWHSYMLETLDRESAA